MVGSVGTSDVPNTVNAAMVLAFDTNNDVFETINLVASQQQLIQQLLQVLIH